ncbi:XRE family transcriptional regulator [Kitasatospora sp. GP82]|uniref:XRE family transcriptional regulator n=1 Tax=Kitasatospora sp. GP82 TaxID=3035089 RepID=UPI002473BFE0|nr:XRE family transcriptional regulator [Kitasatospora sp. GP82]MDH6123457.1 hypothetical protein [Kitasatospora sp. GP82]
MGDNVALRARMADLDLKQAELVRLMNDEIQRLTGKLGTVSERTIHNLLAGVTRWPQSKTRAALTAVFGCTAEELGFTPPGANRPEPPEVPVRRRTFLTSGPTAAAAVAVPLLVSRATVGASDVHRLRAGLETLDALDDHQGGHAALERAALAGARQVLDVQQKGSASERVRRRLFGVAADYTAVAAWSCIDAHELDRAQQHLDHCMTLAGLAQDPTAQFRVWNSIAMLAHQRHRHGEAVAAAHAAQATGITRRDPLFASLGHARTAVGHANRGDRQAALRSIGNAAEALTKTQATLRPSWVAFYGPAELHALTAIVRDRLGDPEGAEGASHRALAEIPQQFRRNRALAMARLALAQLHQRDVDQATASASSVFDLMAGAPIPGRLRTRLGDFQRDLFTLAPNSATAREWADRFRSEWSRP